MYYLLKVLLTLCVVLPILAIGCVGLRFYARRARKLPWLADDWLIAVALVTNIALNAVTFWAVFALALGQPPPTVPPELLEPSWKTLYATIIIEYFTYGIIKVSVILFFKRIFSVGHFAFWANILIVLSVLWTVAGILATACASVPVSLFWKGVFSVNWGALNLSMSAIDMILDVVILLLPLVAVNELQVNRAQKLMILGLFSLGFVCCISSVMRIYYCYQYLYLGPETSFDWFSNVISNTNLWIIAEGNISIIAACMPTLGGLLRVTRSKLTHQSRNYANLTSKADKAGDGTIENNGLYTYPESFELQVQRQGSDVDQNNLLLPRDRIRVTTQIDYKASLKVKS